MTAKEMREVVKNTNEEKIREQEQLKFEEKTNRMLRMIEFSKNDEKYKAIADRISKQIKMYAEHGRESISILFVKYLIDSDEWSYISQKYFIHEGFYCTSFDTWGEIDWVYRGRAIYDRPWSEEFYKLVSGDPNWQSKERLIREKADKAEADYQYSRQNTGLIKRGLLFIQKQLDKISNM